MFEMENMIYKKENLDEYRYQFCMRKSLLRILNRKIDTKSTILEHSIIRIERILKTMGKYAVGKISHRLTALKDEETLQINCKLMNMQFKNG